MDFSNGAGQQSGNDLIPNGTLVWAILNIRGVKSSQSGGEYLDAELTIDAGQPYERKKIWEMIGNPLHSGNSEAYRQMGSIAIARILESGRGAGPNNPQGYHLGRFEELTGLRVPIKIGVSPAKDGYDAKNRVGEWLTPNPSSGSGHKDFVKLTSGQGGVPVAARPAPVAQTSMGFGNTGGAAPAPAQGFGGGNAGGMGGPGSGFGGGQANSGFQSAPGANAGATSTGAGFASNATSHPSEPSPGNWLTQANAGR